MLHKYSMFIWSILILPPEGEISPKGNNFPYNIAYWAVIALLYIKFVLFIWYEHKTGNIYKEEKNIVMY